MIGSLLSSVRYLRLAASLIGTAEIQARVGHCFQRRKVRAFRPDNPNGHTHFFSVPQLPTYARLVPIYLVYRLAYNGDVVAFKMARGPATKIGSALQIADTSQKTCYPRQETLLRGICSLQPGNQCRALDTQHCCHPPITLVRFSRVSTQSQ